MTEILVADGGSTDRTREIVNDLSSKDSRIKLVENPDKYQSYALNKMIKQAKGEVFLRADGHCYYNPDYIEQCVNTLLSTGAKNVGGTQRYKAQNRVQAGIALAVKSFFGNGGAKYMKEDFEGYADTVFLGCFWTKDLKELGGFNTENVTNEDSELNLRINEKFGTQIFISQGIKSWYLPRDNFKSLFIQYHRYGRGRCMTKMLHPKTTPIRGMVPFLFIILLCLFVIIDISMPQALYSFEVLALFVLVLLFESIRVVLTKKSYLDNYIWIGAQKSPGIFSNVVNIFSSLVIMQIGHFTGFLFQYIKSLFGSKKKW